LETLETPFFRGKILHGVALTGYIRGGVTALAGKRDYPVFVDEQIQLCDVVTVSAGVRGRQMLLAPDDYVRATKVTVGAISRSGGAKS
jgi:Cys-tRNA(Pro)/Cys-tRNA(Cys) deacylase